MISKCNAKLAKYFINFLSLIRTEEYGVAIFCAGCFLNSVQLFRLEEFCNWRFSFTILI